MSRRRLIIVTATDAFGSSMMISAPPNTLRIIFEALGKPMNRADRNHIDEVRRAIDDALYRFEVR